MSPAKTSVKVIVKTGLLFAAEFQRLSDIPPEVEWFAKIRNPSARHAEKYAIKDFMLFTGIKWPKEFRDVIIFGAKGDD